jgi:hypothetical protein
MAGFFRAWERSVLVLPPVQDPRILSALHSCGERRFRRRWAWPNAGQEPKLLTGDSTRRPPRAPSWAGSPSGLKGSTP